MRVPAVEKLRYTKPMAVAQVHFLGYTAKGYHNALMGVGDA